jgi:hypothetical protein
MRSCIYEGNLCDVYLGECPIKDYENCRFHKIITERVSAYLKEQVKRNLEVKVGGVK